jgi:hypothetical protein
MADTAGTYPTPARAQAVIASLRTEASPIVLREAFASGRPVIPKVGDIPRFCRILKRPAHRAATVRRCGAILEFISIQLPRTARRRPSPRNGHFSFDKMMEAKLRADVALIEQCRRQSDSERED